MPSLASWRTGRQAASPSTLTVFTLRLIVVGLCCWGAFGASAPPAAEPLPLAADSRHASDTAQQTLVSSKYDDLIARLDETYRALVGVESGAGDNRETRVFDRHGRVMTDNASPSSSASSSSSSSAAAAASGDDERLLQLANALSSSGGWLPAANGHDTLFGRSSLDAVIADLIQLLRDLLRARALDRGETQKSLKLMLDLVEVLWRDRDRM